MKPGRLITIVGPTLVALTLAGVAVSTWSWTRDDGGAIVGGLTRRLRSDDPRDRREAATRLGEVQGPGAAFALRALIVAVRDRDAEVRARSARALGDLGAANPGLDADDAATALTTPLRDDSPRVRASAALGLRGLGRTLPGTLEALFEGLRDGDPFLGAAAESAVAAWPLSDAPTLGRFLGMVDDPSPAVGRAIRSALSRPGAAIPAALAVPALSAALRVGSVAAREVAATMLGRSVERGPAGRDTLMAALRDRAPSVRAIAAASLGAYSEDGLARLALRAATDDPDLRVRATASASLAVGRRSARAEALADVRAALGGVSAEVESQPARAVPRLVVALANVDPRVRAAAARGLGECLSAADDPRPAVDALTLGLADRAPAVRRACAASLARCGPLAASASTALRLATRDADRGVSAQALVALQALDATRARR